MELLPWEKRRIMRFRPGLSDFKLALLQWVILPVFLLRALIPLGFMPDVNNGGALVICSGFESREMPAPHDGGKAGDMPCAFSGLGSALNAQAPSIAPALLMTAMQTPGSHGVLRSHLSSVYQTRAPPVA